jgi:hypothetical protein
VMGHGLLESPIRERVQLAGISLSRFGRRQLAASQETLSFWASVQDDGVRSFLTGVNTSVRPYSDLWAAATQAGVYSNTDTSCSGFSPWTWAGGSTPCSIRFSAR